MPTWIKQLKTDSFNLQPIFSPTDSTCSSTYASLPHSSASCFHYDFNLLNEILSSWNINDLRLVVIAERFLALGAIQRLQRWGDITNTLASLGIQPVIWL